MWLRAPRQPLWREQRPRPQWTLKRERLQPPLSSGPKTATGPAEMLPTLAPP